MIKEFRHEIINFGGNLPIKFFIHRVGSVDYHWHQSIELLIVIKGNVDVKVNNDEYKLTTGDVILINKNEIHSLKAEDTVMVAVQIRLSFFDELLLHTENLYFDCNSRIDLSGNIEKYDRLKRIILEIFQSNSPNKAYIDIINRSYAYALVYELLENFKVEEKVEQSRVQQQKLERLTRILSYINQNYYEPLSLKSLSEREGLSIPYFSRFFKETLGMNFIDYLQKIRLEHALDDFYDKKKPIETIAIDNGFPNVRSFTLRFKEEYNCTPSIYRNKLKKRIDLLEEKGGGDPLINYLDNDNRFLKKGLESLLLKNIENESKEGNKELNSQNIILDFGNTINKKLEHTFRNFIGVSQAKELLYEPVRKMLEIAQKEIGFKYIKVHGLLSDSMMVFKINNDGSIEYNFNLIDQVIDFLLSINLRPLISFSFTPGDLASDHSKIVFYMPLNTSKPNDYDKWNELVAKLMFHFINRYGKAEVLSWLFTVWNEPGESNEMFGFNVKHDYYELYNTTFKMVKSIEPELRFGGPSSFSAKGKSEIWLEEFLDFTINADCKPDFISIHYYDIDLGLENTGKFFDIINRNCSENSLTEFISVIKRILGNRNLNEIPIFLTEWNSTVSHRDLINDTCFSSVYILKNILENYDSLESFGYWLLTDLHEESLLPSETFHGGLGLFTWNSIKKPVYFAYFFLDKLLNFYIDSGPGYFVSSGRDGNYCILVYNYHHFNKLYAQSKDFNISYKDRYSNFSYIDVTRIKLLLKNFSGRYRVTHSVVNREQGSCFDEFIRMGAVEPLSQDDVEYLKLRSVPGIYNEILDFNNIESLVIKMKPFEIRSIELKKICE